MNEDAAVKQRFPVRRSFRKTLVFYLAFAGFGIPGLVLLVLGRSEGWILVAFSASFVAILLAVTLKPGWVYLIDRTGITIQRPLKRGRIPLASISQLKVIGSREAVSLSFPDQVEESLSTRNMDIRGAFRARRRVGKITGFSSVPIVFDEIRAGGPVDIETVGGRASGDFVLVRTIDGSSYLLSPADPDGFVEAYEMIARSGRG
jgi:hypothetical protein